MHKHSILIQSWQRVDIFVQYPGDPSHSIPHASPEQFPEDFLVHIAKWCTEMFTTIYSTDGSLCRWSSTTEQEM